MIGLYALAAAAFGAMTPAFRNGDLTDRGVYVVWYVVMVLESIAVITISSKWRMLSFKKTHLMERMSLLTLIVIGEGAIGVTKSVSRIMGKYGLEFEGCALIMGVIIVLVSFSSIKYSPNGNA
jgi:low temperature requirement protein LtrA